MVAAEEEEEEGFLKGPRGENIMRGEEGGLDSRDSCMILIIFQSYFFSIGGFQSVKCHVVLQADWRAFVYQYKDRC